MARQIVHFFATYQSEIFILFTTKIVLFLSHLLIMRNFYYEKFYFLLLISRRLYLLSPPLKVKKIRG